MTKNKLNKITIVLFIAILLLLSLTFSACTDDTNKGYQKISQNKAYDMMENEQVTILDVRTQEEYDTGHIKNAILLPDYNINSKAEDVLKDKDAKILVYCRSGNRSKTASEDLLKLGYRNVYDFGGINTWTYGTVK